MKVSARLEVGLFDVAQRGQILNSIYAQPPAAGSPLHNPSVADVGALAAQLEAAGFDGAYTVETAHDVFFPLALASQTSNLSLSTSAAIAFPRSPMHVAHQAYDLMTLSKGKFSLGLGSQVKQVNERYYSVPWGKPVERMRDYVLALKAIWRCWQEGTPLRHEGPFFQISFMNPLFNPGPNPYGVPPVLLGALGPKMTQMTAEVADGILIHPLSTERFVREKMVPAIDQGLAISNRTWDDFEVVPMTLIAAGRNEAEQAVADAGVAAIIAFYASTPAYQPIMEVEGLEGLQVELNALAKQGRWTDMAALIDLDILNRFAIRGTPAEIGPMVARRFGDLADRVNSYLPYAASLDLLGEVAHSFHDVA
ncbi:MAG: TIGR03617 family F420-dependent LLM class oxidoreductase [Porticoccaceae bacterium]